MNAYDLWELLSRVRRMFNDDGFSASDLLDALRAECIETHNREQDNYE